MASLALTLTISASLYSSGSANNFLKATASDTRHGHINQDIARASLVEEIEGALGDGSTARRVARLQAALVPMYSALPKNEHGNLAHATVRYALHRLFVQRHALYIRGLEPGGESFNTSSPTEALDDKLPSYVQNLFEKRLNGHGFNLHDTAVFAATLEHLIHLEAQDTLSQAYAAHNISANQSLAQNEVDEVLDTYMKIYIAGVASADATDAQFHDSYPGWLDTKDFVRDMRKNVMYAEGDHGAPPSKQKSSFALVTRIVEEVAQHYGVFQDSECKQMKAELLKYGDKDTGLLRLSSFYQAALDHGSMLYNEPKEYLRELGALDETDPKNPYVIIPNYVNSMSNCIATSSLYSVCCINECEPLLAHLEREVQTSEAAPKHIIELVEQLPSSTVEVPRTLSAPLQYRLKEIADGHGGTVPIHGRLFAQWMHHAFPRECPYPHVSGTRNPQTPDEWMAQYGEEGTMASEIDMQFIIDDARQQNHTMATKELLWSPEEELFALRTKAAPRSAAWNVCEHLLFALAVLGAAYVSMSFRSMGPCLGKLSKRDKRFCDEKHYV